MKAVAPEGVDAVIEMDLTANAKLIPAVLRPKGSVIVYGTLPEATIPAGVLPGQQHPHPVLSGLRAERDRARRRRRGDHRGLKSGRLKNRVAQPTYKLADIVAAHEAVEKGTLGNVVVTL